MGDESRSAMGAARGVLERLDVVVKRERRGARRVQIEIPVAFCNIEGPSPTNAEVTQDVSAGGLLVRTRAVFERGTVLQLWIGSPQGSELITMQAEVIRTQDDSSLTPVTAGSEKKRMVVRFIDAGPATLAKLMADLRAELKPELYAERMDAIVLAPADPLSPYR